MTTDATRIYLVYKVDGSEENLVRAGHKYTAHRFITHVQWGVRLATQEDVLRLTKKGVEVQNAGADGVTRDLFDGSSKPPENVELFTTNGTLG